MEPAFGPETEAAALVRSGALYPRRVGLVRLDDPGSPPTFAGFKRGAFSLFFGDAPIVHCDLEGRWQRAFLGGVHLLRSLGGVVRSVDRPREGGSMVLRRRTFDPAEAAAADREVRELASGLIEQIEGGRVQVVAPPTPARPIAPEELVEVLARIARWDAAAWAGHLDRYRRAYAPDFDPQFPPDLPAPISFDGRIADVADFEAHARGVRDLLGRRAEQSRALLVARLEAERVVDRFDALLRVFPVEGSKGRPRAVDAPDSPAPAPFEAIHAQVDPTRLARFDLATWQSLRARHLRRVSVDLRVALDAPLPLELLSSLVRDLLAAEIGVGLMIRPAGDLDPPRLARDLAAIPFPPGTLIALVEPIALDGLKDQIQALLPPKTARVIAYDPDKQWT